MGFLRVILALAVVVTHCHDTIFGIQPVYAALAVKTFYIISGFYMSLVINEKYKFHKNFYKLFLSNRFLRLYPIYWVILIFTAIFSLLSAHFYGNWYRLDDIIKNFSLMNLFSKIYIIGTNILLFGQDLVMFMGLTPKGMLEFVSNFQNTEPKLFRMLLVPQAWTIGVELFFYLLAPFIVTKSFKAVLIAFLSLLGIKLFFQFNGLNYDPWTYRFFPFELPFFLCGILSYKMYTTLKTKQLKKSNLRILLIVIIGISLFYSNFRHSGQIKDFIYYVLIVFSIPYIYYLTKNNSFDRYFGEYSYSIYICHYLVIAITIQLMSILHINPSFKAEIVTVFTFIASYLLIELVGKRIESLRVRRVAQDAIVLPPGKEGVSGQDISSPAKSE